MKNIYIAIGVAVVIIGALFIFISPEKPMAPAAATIIFSGGQYSPLQVEVSKGDRVEFINSSTDGQYMWPASDLHPTHELYPEFDPREPVGPGDSWSFIFERTGSWGFHDHLHSSRRGMVKVTE